MPFVTSQRAGFLNCVAVVVAAHDEMQDGLTYQLQNTAPQGVALTQRTNSLTDCQWDFDL